MSPAAPDRAVRTAAVELTALAIAVRADWSEDVVAGTIQRGIQAIGWPQVLTRLPALMKDPSKVPGDLLAGPRDKTRIGISDHPRPANAEFRAAAKRLGAAGTVAEALTSTTREDPR
jgi:hypothetical protein